VTEDNLALPIELLGSVERYAVYRCYSDDGQLLYVGETGDLGTRLASHAQKLWFVQVRGITLEWYADELDALKAERRAIHVEHPKYNKQHRMTSSAQVARATPRKRRAKAARPQIDPVIARHQALELWLANPQITGKDLGALVGLGERWGQLRKTEFVNASAGTARSDERS
jgi:predicted GIY-YIG superfamily endonuclease